MENTLQGNASMVGRTFRLMRGLGWGMLGGFAGTLVMDLALMGVLSAFGSPALTCFSIVGNTVARFFSIQSIDAAGAIRLGVATHYLVGPLIGALFGAVVAGVDTLRVKTMKKIVLLAILYVQILSQPLLAMTPILLKMTCPETLTWYGGSFFMHLLVGVVLGLVVGRGLRLITAGNQR